MQAQNLNRVLGVELKIIDQQLFSCRWCVLSKQKNMLNIEQQKMEEGPFNAILAALPKTYPIALTINGKGVIHKNGQFEIGLTFEQLFQQLFPAIAQENFYTQHFRGQSFAALSVVRKEMLDELLTKMKNAGLQVFSISLGGWPAVHIFTQLNSYDPAEVKFDGHCFNLNEEKALINYQYDHTRKSKFQMKIAEEPIAEENIIAYASAFQLMMYQQLNAIIVDVATINNSFTQFIAHHQLKKKALIFLFSLFIALLISFSLFSYYNESNAQLVQLVGAQSVNENQMDVMKQNIAENEALLQQLNWNGGYNYGFLLNEIGVSMPRQIQLLSVSMNEFKSEIEKTTRRPLIKIIGTTDNLTAVNNWIFMLKEKPWIKTVKLLKYQEMEETAFYQFNLELSY